MSILPWRDHGVRIKALEDQVAALIRIVDGSTTLTQQIVEKMGADRAPEVDHSWPGYYR